MRTARLAPMALVLCGVLVILTIAERGWGQCTPSWNNLLFAEGPPGNGPMRLGQIGGATAIAVGGGNGVLYRPWPLIEGSQWQALGSNLRGQVLGLVAIDPDGSGPLEDTWFASGSLSINGGTNADMVVRLDGSTWVEIGRYSGTFGDLVAWDADASGPGAAVVVLAANDGFNSSANIRGWNGASWVSLPGFDQGSSGFLRYQVNGLLAWDRDGAGPPGETLVAAGAASNPPLGAPGPYGRIATWNGQTQTWMTIASTAEFVSKLTTWDIDGNGPLGPQLVASGQWAPFGQSSTPAGIRRYNGTSWIAVGVDSADSVGGIAAVDFDGSGVLVPELLATRSGGLFLRYGVGGSVAVAGVSANGPLVELDLDGSGPLAGVVSVGGSVSAPAATVRSLLGSWSIWDGTFWQNPTSPIVGTVSDIESWSEATGNGTRQVLAVVDQGNRVLTFRDGAWQQLGGAFTGTVEDVFVADLDGQGPEQTTIFAAGSFTINSQARTGIARWTGSTWSAVGSSFFQGQCLQLWDADGNSATSPVLVAGGTLANPTTGLAEWRVATWDGSAWTALGGVFNSTITSLTAVDIDGEGPGVGQLFAGGFFSTVGGQPIRAMARLSGSQWVALGTGLPSGAQVWTMTPWDRDGAGPANPALVVGGQFNAAGGVQNINNVALWDGQGWFGLASGLNSRVDSVGIWDRDGAGPGLGQLVAGGLFRQSGTASVSKVAVFDGLAWQGIDSRLPDFSSSIAAIGTLDPDGSGPLGTQLVVGGDFRGIGSRVAGLNLSSYGCVTPIDDGSGRDADLVVVAASTTGLSGEVLSSFGARVRVENRGSGRSPSAGVAISLALVRPGAPNSALLVVGGGYMDGPLEAGQGVDLELRGVIPSVFGEVFDLVAVVNPGGLAVERDITNNQRLVVGGLDVRVPSLTLGQLRVVELDAGQSRLFRVEGLIGGQSLRVTSAGPQGSSSRIRLRNTLPASEVQWDVSSASLASGVSEAQIETARLGPTYVLVSNEGDNSITCDVLAQVPPTQVESLDRSLLPVNGQSTLVLWGASLVDDLQVVVEDSSGSVFGGSYVRVNSFSARATFSIAAASVGSGELRIISGQTGLTVATFAITFVDPGTNSTGQGGLSARIFVPSEVRVDREFPVRVEVTNSGLTDVVAPLVLVKGSHGFRALVQPRGQGAFGGVLLPGSGASAVVTAKVQTAELVTFSANVVLTGSALFDWAGFAANYRPPTFSPAQWQETVNQARGQFGETWAEVLTNLRPLLEQTPAGAQDIEPIDLLRLALGAAPGGGPPDEGPGGLPGVSVRVVTPPNWNGQTVMFTHGYGGLTSSGDGRQFGDLTTDQRIAQLTSQGVRVAIGDWSGQATGPLPENSAINKIRNRWIVGNRLDAVASEMYRQMRAFGVEPANTAMVSQSFGCQLTEAINNESLSRGRLPFAHHWAMNAAASGGGEVFEPNSQSTTVTVSPQEIADAETGNGPRDSTRWFYIFSDPSEQGPNARHDDAIQLGNSLLGQNNTSRFLDLAFGRAEDVNNARHIRNRFYGTLSRDGTAISSQIFPNQVRCSATTRLCVVEPPSVETDAAGVLGSQSVDPNDIVGPRGAGDERWVAGDRPLAYTIRFENLPAASAHAQVVTITHQLDADLDATTVQLGEIALGDRSFSFGGGTFDHQLIDLRPEQPWLLDAKCELHLETRTLTWVLKSVDPRTLELPFGVNEGLLPPNTEPPSGEGFVTFSVRPQAAVLTGTRVEAQASIVFDTNAAILTPSIFNTIDVNPPGVVVSSVRNNGGGQIDIAFDVVQSDVGSGLDRVRVFGRGFEEGFTPLVNASIAAGRVIVPLTPGQQVDLFVAGVDAAGNVQRVPTVRSVFIAPTACDLNGDGLGNNTDFVVYVDWFFASDARADVGSQGGIAQPDGRFTNDDFVVFVTRFFAACF